MEEKAGILAKLKMLEHQYPEGKCGYCMKAEVHLMAIDCGLNHAFCGSCVANLIKITRVKKAMV